jgi:hypothetical protein
VLGAGVIALWFGYVVLYAGTTYLGGHPEGFVTVIWRHRSCGTAPAPAPKKKAK